MDQQLDEIDRHVIHALMRDARNTSAPTIADEVNVSPGTIRNRISRLEDQGILTGYHANINFERVESRLKHIYICTAPVSERETLAQQARIIPGVIHVRELMAGRQNLHVLAVGEDTEDLRRIAKTLSDLGIEIEDEDLVQNESFQAYAPFSPDDGTHRRTLADFISLAGSAEVIEITVREDAPVAGTTLEEAGRNGALDPETLVIAIERDGTVLTPRGGTTIEPDDIVTVFSRGGVSDRTLGVFTGSEHQ